MKRKELRKEINRLKSAAWQELIDTIDRDPWGLPYKIVLKKLKTASLRLTEKLEEDLLDELLNSLFPIEHGPTTLGDWSNFTWSEDLEVNIGVVHKVIRKVSSSPSKVPGPDGFRRIIIKQVNDEFLEWIRYIYNLCLKLGEFPAAWKCASLILFPKPGPAVADTLPKVRPICLINEVAKVFERIIADRIHLWQMEHPESDLSDNQFGFRKRRSTCDAIARFRELTTGVMNNGEYAIAVGLDIKNAFNSIPWHVIRRALRDNVFPQYLRRIIDSYLSDREIQYIDRHGTLR